MTQSTFRISGLSSLQARRNRLVRCLPKLAGLTVEQVAQFANHGFGLESTSEFSVQSIDETVDGDKELPEFHDLPLFPQDLSSAKQLAIDPPRPLGLSSRRKRV